LDIEQTSLMTASGRPLSSKTINKSAGETGVVDIVYDLKAANANITVGAKKITRSLPYPSGKPLSQPSTLWWFVNKPKPGATSIETELDDTSLTFKTTKTKFVGVVTKTFAGKSRKVNEVKTSEGNGWMDDAGMPWRIEQKTAVGLMVMERKV